ncbi:MAG: hypothetical protein WCK86_03330 [Planctomycetia bacterium]
MRTLLLLIFPLIFISLQGCQCFRCSERYNDAIDDVSDHIRSGPKFDNVYCEELDATRWCMNCRNRRCTCPGTFPRHRPR